MEEKKMKKSRERSIEILRVMLGEELFKNILVVESELLVQPDVL